VSVVPLPIIHTSTAINIIIPVFVTLA
jgi:hypothetical protein